MDKNHARENLITGLAAPADACEFVEDSGADAEVEDVGGEVKIACSCPHCCIFLLVQFFFLGGGGRWGIKDRGDSRPIMFYIFNQNLR